MPEQGLIVIGASAGGVETLIRLVGDLPADLPAAICVVLHMPASSKSNLPSILGRAGALPAKHPEDEETIQPGIIYVAPPNRHLLVADGHLRLTSGPRENGHRPAIDPLFRTAAQTSRQRVIGVVLSGTLDDGALGLKIVRHYGGQAVVQDPNDALYGDMPRNAIENVKVNYILPLDQIGPTLVTLVHQLMAQEEEVRGQNFLSLDIGLPVEQLKPTIRACLSGEADHQQVALLATNRRGKPLRLQVTCSRLLGVDGDGQGLILLMEERPPEAEPNNP